MAKPGIKFRLSLDQKNSAFDYVRASGFFKNRLASFLKISRPTLDRLLEEDEDFFTQIKAADAEFCKDLIELVKKKDPKFILRTKYIDEFNDSLKYEAFDPVEEIQRVKRLIDKEHGRLEEDVSSTVD